MKPSIIRTIILGLGLIVLSFSKPIKSFANNQLGKCVTVISSNCKSSSNPFGF